MSSDWRLFAIEDLCNVGSSKRIFAHDYVESGIPFYASKDVIDKALGSYSSPAVYISEKRFTDIADKFGYPQKGDLLLSSVGNRAGIPYVVQNEGKFYFKDGNVTWFKDFKSLNSDFLCYWLKSNVGQNALHSIMIGSAQKALTISGLQKLKINLPSEEVQRDIVSILKGIDNRIALLRETNATLEAIAQGLFKSWFVDFDPVHAKQSGQQPDGIDEATAALFPDSYEESQLGLVPTGWRMLPVGEVVAAVGGATPDTKDVSYWEPGEHCWTTPKDLSGLSTPILLKTERKISSKGLAKIGSGLLPTGTLLMSSRAPIGYLALAQVPIAVNQGYIAILPKGKLSPLYMLHWCRQNIEVIKARANGSTFMEISKKAFRPIPCLVPKPDLLAAFDSQAGTLFDRIIENERQSASLADIRDALLPRLISGQLSIADVEVTIESSEAP
jgi:type I restriction enzyme S subunit